jgi:beta-galactosidase
VPVTTNFALGAWVAVDHARWAAEVDIVAIDHYPSATGAGADEQTALAADTARGWAAGAGAKPWLLMESAANLIYAGARMHAREPGQLLRHSLAHMARGSRGVMFFQWRAPRGGAEAYHAAMVPHAGPDTRVFAEVCALGAALRRLAEVGSARVVADVAIVRDAASAWALGGPGLPSPDLDHDALVADAHRAAGRAGHTADVVGSGADLTGYRLVLIPGLYIASEATAAAVRAYVRAGGTAIIWYASGIVDESLRVWTGAYPGAFRDVLGVRVVEWRPLAADAGVALSTGDAGRAWTEAVELAGAEAVIRYADGSPAVTRHQYGAGTAWYLSTRLDPAGLARVLAQAGPGPEAAAADGLDLVRRRAGGTEWLFAINNTAEQRDVPAEGMDLLTDARVTGALRLPPGACAVIRTA